MPLLQLQDVTLKYGAEPLLETVNLRIEPGERVCLVGRNGTGKTSLLRLLTGEEKPNAGERLQSPGLVVARLDQAVPSDLEGTVSEVIHAGLSPERHEEEWEAEVRLEQLMDTMRLPVDAPFPSLSGGLKRRVLLGRALAARPDLLLLDEPTNHLDLEAILWLEQFLAGQDLALFFVTHDRAFLRRLATRIVELDRGQLTSWDCDYDTFIQRKADWLAAEEKQWAQFDKKLAQEEAWIRQGIQARRTRNEGRVKALKRLRDDRRKRRERQGQVKLEVQAGAASGQKVLEVKDAGFAYEDGHWVFRNFTATLWRGDKVGIIGPNGSGKTTLLKLLLGQLQPVEGLVTSGTQLEVVYLDQMRSQIRDDLSVMENVAGKNDYVDFNGRRRHAHGYLQDFLFSPGRARQPARVLSGGERNRLLLARLFLQPANVLVLDEPTNDLDTETLELLEALLVDYDGTLLLVSHDRVFLDNVVTSTLVFEGDGHIGDYVGGYSDWKKWKAAASTPPPAPVPKPIPAEDRKAPAKKGPVPKPRKFLNREQRELDALPGRIEALEKQQAELMQKLADPALYHATDGAFDRVRSELHSVEREHESAFKRWETLEALKKACEAGTAT